MVIEKAEGVNESERYLQKLCDKTFLSLWSYPAVHKEKGKECCDLLVVFENHVIIFSDKDCQFPDSGQIKNDWNRWFKKAIQKSAEQAWGAERWIKKYPHQLFLDSLCEKPFPLEIPDLSTAKFHLIIVAHGSSTRCQQELGGSGSLMINSSIKGFPTHDAIKNGGIPFMVGDIDPSRTFVHILDDTSLEIVVGTLDTIADFVSYLTEKEKFLRSGKAVIACGEGDLLAYYLTHVNEQNQHDFGFFSQFDDTNVLVFEEGFWEQFVQSPERQSQISADKISYFWDCLIKITSNDVMKDTLYSTSHQGFRPMELLLRLLARESRLGRRTLSATLLELIKSAPRDTTQTRYCYSPPSLYVFLTLPQFEEITYEEYREMRQKVLEVFCLAVKLKFINARHIIGMAFEPGISDASLFKDMVYFDATDWTEEDAIRAREIVESTDILKNVDISIMNVQKYPHEQSRYPLHETVFECIDPTKLAAQNNWEVKQ
jgi:hypothetical protein